VLTSRHTGEDEGAFPVLAARIPEFRPVLAELERDHHIVADGLRDLQRLVDGLEAGAAPDPRGSAPRSTPWPPCSRPT
jgi:hypothetical protein